MQLSHVSDVARHRRPKLLRKNADCEELAHARQSGADSVITNAQGTLESLNRHPLPQWYAEAKLGIFIYWGAIPSPRSAPSGNPRDMYRQDSELDSGVGHANAFCACRRHRPSRLAASLKRCPDTSQHFPPQALAVRVGSPNVASVPGARLHGIGVSLHKTLVSGAFSGRPFLHLPIPARGRGGRRSD